MSDEFDHIRPYSQIQIAMQPGDAILVLETPEQIRELVDEALKDNEGDRMGLELGSGEDGRPKQSVTLTALDIWAKGDGTFDMEPYELTAWALFTSIRGISQHWWETYLDGNRRRQREQGAAGLGVTVIGPDFTEAFQRSPAQPLSMEEFEENRTLVCCCGHEASGHVQGQPGEFLGSCSDPNCGCPRFHTHPAPE